MIPDHKKIWGRFQKITGLQILSFSQIDTGVSGRLDFINFFLKTSCVIHVPVHVLLLLITFLGNFVG